MIGIKLIVGSSVILVSQVCVFFAQLSVSVG